MNYYLRLFAKSTVTKRVGCLPQTSKSVINASFPPTHWNGRSVCGGDDTETEYEINIL